MFVHFSFSVDKRAVSTFLTSTKPARLHDAFSKKQDVGMWTFLGLCPN